MTDSDSGVNTPTEWQIRQLTAVGWIDVHFSSISSSLVLYIQYVSCLCVSIISFYIVNSSSEPLSQRKHSVI